MTNKKTYLAKVDVIMADGTGTTWTRDDDGLSSAVLTETNALMIMGDADRVMMLYSPMFWLSVESTYETVTE